MTPSTVYVSCWNEDKVVVYDDATIQVIREIPGVKTPTGIFNVGIRQEGPGA